MRDMLAKYAKSPEWFGKVFQTFYPVIREVTSGTKKTLKIVEKPAYTGYLWAKMKMDREIHDFILSMPGVSGFMGPRIKGKGVIPKPVSEEQVLRLMIESKKEVDRVIDLDLIVSRKGDMVEITQGEFAFCRGTVTSVTEKTVRVKVVQNKEESVVDLPHSQVRVMSREEQDAEKARSMEEDLRSFMRARGLVSGRDKGQSLETILASNAMGAADLDAMRKEMKKAKKERVSGAELGADRKWGKGFMPLVKKGPDGTKRPVNIGGDELSKKMIGRMLEGATPETKRLYYDFREQHEKAVDWWEEEEERKQRRAKRREEEEEPEPPDEDYYLRAIDPDYEEQSKMTGPVVWAKDILKEQEEKRMRRRLRSSKEEKPWSFGGASAASNDDDDMSNFTFLDDGGLDAATRKKRPAMDDSWSYLNSPDPDNEDEGGASLLAKAADDGKDKWGAANEDEGGYLRDREEYLLGDDWDLGLSSSKKAEPKTSAGKVVDWSNDNTFDIFGDDFTSSAPKATTRQASGKKRDASYLDDPDDGTFGGSRDDRLSSTSSYKRRAGMMDEGSPDPGALTVTPEEDAFFDALVAGGGTSPPPPRPSRRTSGRPSSPRSSSTSFGDGLFGDDFGSMDMDSRSSSPKGGTLTEAEQEELDGWLNRLLTDSPPERSPPRGRPRSPRGATGRAVMPRRRQGEMEPDDEKSLEDWLKSFDSAYGEGPDGKMEKRSDFRDLDDEWEPRTSARRARTPAQVQEEDEADKALEDLLKKLQAAEDNPIGGDHVFGEPIQDDFWGATKTKAKKDKGSSDWALGPTSDDSWMTPKSPWDEEKEGGGWSAPKRGSSRVPISPSSDFSSRYPSDSWDDADLDDFIGRLDKEQSSEKRARPFKAPTGAGEVASSSKGNSGKADWSSMTLPELKAELKKRGLPVTGNKASLIARLEEA